MLAYSRVERRTQSSDDAAGRGIAPVFAAKTMDPALSTWRWSRAAGKLQWTAERRNSHTRTTHSLARLRCATNSTPQGTVATYNLSSIIRNRRDIQQMYWSSGEIIDCELEASATGPPRSQWHHHETLSDAEVATKHCIVLSSGSRVDQVVAWEVTCAC
ncbi:hypothetical protein BR93DRAFT_423271 [Coniochaeta sp. PMI_546]|nr:hypothetical protein BR93DRAFT_423271 [Coniochaeta sp. PMI_546]